jgi:hypothetical protein
MKQKISLSDQSKAIILGSLLGDGSLKIHTPYKNARFSFRHSSKQKEYFLWKAAQLKEISSDKSVFLQNADGYGKVKKLRYQSRAQESLSEVYNLTHKRGKLRIRRKWLNMITPLSLAIWWLDDGSLIVNSRRGVLCTDGFDKESLKIITQYLKTVWNIKVHIGAIGRKRDGKKKEYYRLWIRSSEELQKFLRIILPYVQVENMLPKVILLYKDPQLQQRWISEIETMTNFSKKTIEKYVELKRLKWKQFRSEKDIVRSLQ